MKNNKYLKDLAQKNRLNIIKMFYKSKTGHMAPALSCIDILTALYFGGILENDEWGNNDRDRVILSKGHACAAIYSILAEKGCFSKEELMTFYQKNTMLQGHPRIGLAGIETATGSLGHGICFATGVAKAGKLDDKDYRVYAIIGDGEMQEGSVWEAALFASANKLDNITVVLDNNKLQASARTADVLPLESIQKKWESFGWQVIAVDGHDLEALVEAFEKVKNIKDMPSIIVASTIKGKGVSFAENNEAWHSRAPKDKEWEQLCTEMGISVKNLEII